MKIHLVSEHASPLALLGGADAGGQNVHVAALAQHLAAAGAEVVVHTRRDDPRVPRRVPFGAGVVVDHVDAGPPEPVPKDDLLPYMADFADELARQWSQDRPDVVHAHFWMSGLAAVDAADRVGVPVALTYHALGREKRRQQGAADTSPSARIAIEDWLARTVDCVIATTAAECRTLVESGADVSRLHVVPCGVDLRHFAPLGPTWPTTPGRRRIVSVSRLVPRKGIADVVEAVAALPDTELVVAGGPPRAFLDQDPHACELIELAERLGAADRVTLLGAVEHERVPSLLRSADVVCCTPWYEPFGLVAVEAMACGVPVVATAVGGLAETVIDGTTGALVPPRRPDAIRAAIEGVTSSGRRRVRMSKSAAGRAARYGWEEIAQSTLLVAEGLVQQGRRGDVEPLPHLEKSATYVRAGGS
jgi:D-inositol-3-phosphate glycosyltransferase